MKNILKKLGSADFSFLLDTVYSCKYFLIALRALVFAVLSSKKATFISIGLIWSGWWLFSSPDYETYEALIEAYSKPSEQWPPPTIDEGIEWQELGEIPPPTYPEGEKPEALIALGKQLFFDPRISATGQIACVSCHHPDQRWTDNRRVSLGHNLLTGKRNAPSIANLANTPQLFWDGRAASLEKQALEPISNSVEMNTSIQSVVDNVNAIDAYRMGFRPLVDDAPITAENIIHAIASFERSIVSRNGRFDRFLQHLQPMNEQQLRGLHLFRTKGRCMNCHNGPTFTDNKFHNLGLTYYGRKYEDLGRYNVTKNPEDVGKFKTPSLRDVMRTRPWMHNGLFNNMDGIMNMYNAGMAQPKPKPHQKNDPLFPKTSPLLKPLNLTKEERDAIKAFLETITSH